MRTTIARRLAWAPAVLGGWVWLAAGGCAPGVAVPPASTGDSVVPPSSPSQVPTIGLVVPESGLQAASIYEQTVRNEAARGEVLCEVVQSRPGGQAEAIREVLRRGITALILVPAAGESIASAVDEARASGVPVVLLDRPAAVEGGALPRVAYTPYEESARELVSAAVESARKAGFDAEAPAVVVANGPFDDAGREMVAALHRALDEAKVPTLPDVTFAGFQQQAREAFEAFFKEHPEVAMVFAIDDQAIRSIGTVRDELDHEQRRFVLAGFAFERETIRMSDFNIPAALAEVRPEALARRAFQVARERSDGPAPSDPIVVETRILRSFGPERRGYFIMPRPAVQSAGFSQSPPAPGGRPTAGEPEGRD